MKIEDIKNIKTQAEARRFAIDWQSWQSNKCLSYGDVMEWFDAFELLAQKFELVEEFEENGII